MLDFVLNFLYPQSCIICGKLNSNYICKICEKRFKKYIKYNEIDNKQILENKFGKSYNKNSYFMDGKWIYWDKLIYIFDYKNIIRKFILEYKFNDKTYLSNFFAYEILKSKKVFQNLKICDIIVPVPMHKRKKRERGYNQTELITKIISQKVGIPEERILIKTRETETQSLLKYKERMKNIRNAFKIIHTEDVIGKNIILFDDIYTTGATVNEISKILKEAGAKKIIVLVLAKD